MENQAQSYRIPLYYLVTSLFWFSLYAFVPNLPIYAESLGASNRLIGLIISSYGFVQMVLRLPLGIYSDKINARKRFILLGILISVISSLGMGFFKTPWSLLVFRGLSGAAAAAWVPFTVLFSSYFTDQQSTKAMGYINAFNNLGQIAALLLGGLVISIFNSAVAPFYLAAAVGALALLLGTGIVENKTEHKPIKLTELLAVGKDARLLIASGLAILSQINAFATVYGFTPLAAKALGANQGQISLLTTLSTFPGIFAAALSGSNLVVRFGKRRTLTLGFIVMALSAALIPFINSINLLYLSQIAGGFARGAVFSLLMSISIQSVSNDKKATAMGFFQAIYGLGMFVGPIMVGFISDFLNLSWGFWITGLIGIMGAFMTYCLPSLEYRDNN
ncbi:MAG TPA: MFS transporter [Clostridia bacterium]|nr:MFS transporter [Clostridia bacterium]